MTIDGDKVTLTHQEFEQISTMLHFIAIRYNNWSGVEYDDLKSELWLRSLEIIRKSKKIELNWIAKCCYNLCKDICRRAKKNWDKCDTDSESAVLDNPKFDANDPNIITDERYMENIVVQEIVDSFPKNSREQNYLIYLTLYLGLPLKEHTDKGLTYNKVYGNLPNNYRRELAIAHALGFSDDTSSGYRRAKYAVRSKLAEMYGVAI